ncbi:hypothetical protein TELCIR_17803 [Teladorsagia circumcincta]|uniref:Uncharacterized protein n=1 Tax=Teladorsagia circumcincta TaxID=45464 RepID=A0A2G9TRY3_TELCI|nr:hypothetical protein TELCIR_17803 [Teladorsagia circumcincta]
MYPVAVTQATPDVSLPGQDKDFSGHAQLNPFTHMAGVGVDLDLGDSWGAGYALQGVNFLEETLIKRDEHLIDIRHTRFSLPIPGTDQRLPFKAHLFERFNDVNLNFAHVLPSINTHRVRTDDIVDELVSNRANPTLVG